MSRLGASLLQQLLAADTGHRGPRIDCGAGHHAAFVGYRDKNLDTVLGRVVVRRAYYHCASCGRGVVPRDDELGVAGASLSPGLRKITARAAATAPFAQAADLLADLAGIRLNPKRIERSAEADGGAAAARLTTESAAIAHRRVAVLPTTARGGPDKLYIAVDGTGVPWTQDMYRSSRQNSQVPSEEGERGNDQVAFLTAVTSEPVFSTMPMNSFPIRAGSSAVDRPEGLSATIRPGPVCPIPQR